MGWTDTVGILWSNVEKGLILGNDTIKSIAEFSQKPSFSLGSGALGIAITDIEAQSYRCLALATRWDVLVINEANIFMEARG